MRDRGDGDIDFPSDMQGYATVPLEKATHNRVAHASGQSFNTSASLSVNALFTFARLCADIKVDGETIKRKRNPDPR
jgi:hypothetical protein